MQRITELGEVQWSLAELLTGLLSPRARKQARRGDGASRRGEVQGCVQDRRRRPVRRGSMYNHARRCLPRRSVAGLNGFAKAMFAGAPCVATTVGDSFVVLGRSAESFGRPSCVHCLPQIVPLY